VSNKIKSTFWIDGIELTKIDGESYVPTCLCYLDESNLLFGDNAITHEKQGALLNNNFKVELGNIKPGSVNRKKFDTESGREKSAHELTKDYFDKILANVLIENPCLLKENNDIAAKIIVAEPLSFQIEGYDSSWIANYRENIRRILSRYEEVDFLPEPFAVYQYYRYGLRLPQLKDDIKHVALIIDFGGGTFDACIIESTQKGDVSLTGKHSKPLAASSCPFGGYFINHVISEYLIKRDLEPSDRKKTDTFIRTYKRVINREILLSTLNQEKQLFIKNFETLVREVEGYKIELCNKIYNWTLESQAYEKITIKIPSDPFSNTKWKTTEFFSHEFRKIFKAEVWRGKLSKVINQVLSRGHDELKDKSISITLISGGSSNIRWLEKLLLIDFGDILVHAEPIPIRHSFQEIVAKGLSIECARRYYDDNSEFVSVTYNPIRLTLDPDRKGLEIKKYSSVENKIDMDGAKPGDLMPSAQSLNKFIDQPLQWKVKLSHAPKHRLDYFFIRHDSENMDDYYNVDSKTVNTVDSKKFDSHIRVQLTIREDGTVVPKFIYKTGNIEHNIKENSVVGKPFVLDMTSEDKEKGLSGHYVGLDFGTSNSSVCTITNENVKKLQIRESDQTWVSLKDSLKLLPYPVAISIRKYLNVKNSANEVAIARDAFESVLAFMAYTASAELMANNLLEGVLKNYAHRSMGPLKDLLIRSLNLLGEKSFFSKEYTVLINNCDDLNEAIKNFTDHKHEKLSAKNFDAHAHLLLIVNYLLKSMEGKLFGFCSTMEKEKFRKNSFNGHFKVAHDVQPFVDNYAFNSKLQYSAEEALLYDKETSKCLNLMPFIIWGERESSASPYLCYWFDKYDKKTEVTTLKQCDEKAMTNANELSDDLSEIYNELVNTGLKNYSSINTVNISDLDH